MELLDANEAAAYLTIKVKHLRSLVYLRKIPYTKVGGSLRFYRDDLDDYVRANRVDVR